MNEFLIPLLSFVSVAATGGAVLQARSLRRAPLRARLRAIEGQGDGSVATGSGASGTDMLAGIGRLVAGRGPSESLKKELSAAGWAGPEAASVYLGAKMLLLFVGAAGMAGGVLWFDGSMAVGVPLSFMAGMALFFLPNGVVRHRRRQRQAEVCRNLPDAIDLLEICVLAGMGLDAAWNAVSDEMRRISPLLADEMALTNLEIHLGASRATAQRHMAERTGAEEIGSLSAVLAQSEKFGTSIADALTAVARSMRERRSQQAEEAAERMAVKLLVPMILFILPAMLTVVVGPAALTIAAHMGGD